MDADDYHPECNKLKMGDGTPLTDDVRYGRGGVSGEGGAGLGVAWQGWAVWVSGVGFESDR